MEGGLIDALESRIRRVSDEINHYTSCYENTRDSLLRGAYKDEINRGNHELARLKAMRSPEMVARLERERGLV